MNSALLDRSEYNSYYHPYISGLGNVDLLSCLKKDLDSFSDFIIELPEDKLDYAYDREKWTVAEVLMHLVDAERIFQYRALRFARNDTTEIPGFDQDLYVPNSRAGQRSKEAIAREFSSVRNASITLFDSFDEKELKNLGKASGSPMSVRALGFVICGHLKHHRHILLQKYL